jgi:hypothetical protein
MLIHRAHAGYGFEVDDALDALTAASKQSLIPSSLTKLYEWYGINWAGLASLGADVANGVRESRLEAEHAALEVLYHTGLCYCTMLLCCTVLTILIFILYSPYYTHHTVLTIYCTHHTALIILQDVYGDDFKLIDAASKDPGLRVGFPVLGSAFITGASGMGDLNDWAEPEVIRFFKSVAVEFELR